MRTVVYGAVVWLAAFAAGAPPAAALPPETLASVVSVLPQWPGRAQGGGGAQTRGRAPEGSGVVVRPGVVATAWHVVEPARRIDVRLSDGRVAPARLLAHDAASDVALLAIEATPPPPVIETTLNADLAQPVCAVANAYGLGLSVTCGVVSARPVTDAGFNAVEDFVQTDAAANPGSSGGALVDREGRLVGMISAIFASRGDGDIGVNFAVSTALLLRVTDALLERGVARYPDAGWRLARADRAQLARRAGAAIAAARPGGAAERAGLRAGDVVVRVGERAVRAPRDAIAALAVLPEEAAEAAVTALRDGAEITVRLPLDRGASAAEPADAPAPPAGPAPGPRAAPDGAAPARDCPHPAPVCAARASVFPVSSFDPLASATRIGPDLLVTNRHVVADRARVLVQTPDGPREGRVVPSAYRGDLALIEAAGLPADGPALALDGAAPETGARVFAVGADATRRMVRVFAPGAVLAQPAPGAPLGRLHVSARMQPGVSGGALVGADGALVGVAVGGGEGRFEAIPLADLRALLTLRDAPEASRTQAELGGAFARCAAALAEGGPEALARLSEACAAADNAGQLLEAGRALAAAGDIDGAAALHAAAAAQTPNGLNARLSLLTSLQLGGRFPEMLEHARRAMAAAPRDPRALRFAIQAGVWGGEPALAEAGYAALLDADPRQAAAARRFIDAAPPAPPRR